MRAAGDRYVIPISHRGYQCAINHLVTSRFTEGHTGQRILAPATRAVTRDDRIVPIQDTDAATTMIHSCADNCYPTYGPSASGTEPNRPGTAGQSRHTAPQERKSTSDSSIEKILEPGPFTQMVQFAQGGRVENSTESQRGLRGSKDLANTKESSISAIKILLVNDERLVLEGLRLILRGYPEFSVVATARDRKTALQQIFLHRPHIVLIGLGPHIYGTDDIEVTRIIRRHHAHVKIVILASNQQPFYMREAFLAGAHGYLSKNIDQSELRASLRAVYREGAVLPKDMARCLLRMISGGPLIEGDPLSGLNEKEREIVFMMARGHDTNYIATSLSLSPKTIRNYFSRIYAKLGTGNRLQTALYASGRLIHKHYDGSARVSLGGLSVVG